MNTRVKRSSYTFVIMKIIFSQHNMIDQDMHLMGLTKLNIDKVVLQTNMTTANPPRPGVNVYLLDFCV